MRMSDVVNDFNFKDQSDWRWLMAKLLSPEGRSLSTKEVALRGMSVTPVHALGALLTSSSLAL